MKAGLGPACGKARHARWWKSSVRRSIADSSPALNALARRFLLTTAGVPEGSGNGQNLVVLASTRLLALGATAEAWKLAQAAKPGQVDDATLRRAAETALLDPASDVCAKLPEKYSKPPRARLAKAQVVCQLRAQ